MPTITIDPQTMYELGEEIAANLPAYVTPMVAMSCVVRAASDLCKESGKSVTDNEIEALTGRAIDYACRVEEAVEAAIHSVLAFR